MSLLVKLAQINGGQADQNYIPLSAAYLQVHAEKHLKEPNRFKFEIPIYTRTPVETAVKQLEDADVVGISTYVWNFELSRKIAAELKRRKPNILTIFGGPHVPEKRTPDFMSQNPFIDVAVAGEGERAFSAILERFPNIVPEDLPKGEDIGKMEDYLEKNIFPDIERSDWRKNRVRGTLQSLIHSGSWGEVSSINVRQNGNIVSIPIARRMGDLNEVPSPYLNGTFEQLMARYPDENWTAIWETNRGCPFACAFCDWGNTSKDKMTKLEIERVYGEQDWFSKKRIEFVWCADANFGMYQPRDVEIAKRMAENKEKYGYPKYFTVQGTKSPNDQSFEGQLILDKSGLSRGVLIAFQSLNPETLKAVDRGNISLDKFFHYQREFAKRGVDTFSDLILGNPLETYHTFTKGISYLLDMGQHNRIQFNNLSILPNAPMADPVYIRKYGLDIVETPIVNAHGPIDREADEVEEKQQLVVATNTMSREDWVRTRSFAYRTSALHFNKLLQIPLLVAHHNYGLNYNRMIDEFGAVSPESAPVIASMNRGFDEQAKAIQRGSPEFTPSRNYLGIYWYPDENALVDMVMNNKLDQFYRESNGVFSNMIGEEVRDGSLLDSALRLNREVFRLPRQPDSEIIEHPYNTWELYKSLLISSPVEVKNKKHRYAVERKERWETDQDWMKKMVWYKNKRGAYLNSAQPI